MESFYQGQKDIFLVGVRADFQAVEDQAVKSVTSLEKNGLLNSDTTTDGLFTQMSNVTSEGNSVVWRHVSVAGLESLSTRQAGGQYPEGSFPRGWETVVTDPNIQDASQVVVPDERMGAESSMYKAALNRAQKLILATRRKNHGDPFDVLNQAFVAPTSYASQKFVGKGNQGLDGNFTALNEALVTANHKIAKTNAAATGSSNAVGVNSQYSAFDATSFYAALEQATTIVDDVGLPMPMFGGQVAIVVANANGLMRTAMEINKSDLKPFVANNEVNVMAGLLGKIVTSPYLTNSINYTAANTQNKKWYLIDTASQDPQVGTGLIRVSFLPTESRVERNQELDAITYKVKQSYSYAWCDYRNVLASLGDGSTIA